MAKRSKQNEESEMEHINIKLGTIKINLDTNIPEGYSSTGEYKTKQLTLTSGLLGIANAGGNDPLFSADVLYQDGAGFFSGLKPEEKPAVFFNPSKFREFINKCYSNRRKRVSASEYKEIAESALETPNDFAHRNVLFMCKMLFHTSFPKKQNFTETYNGPIAALNLGTELTELLRSGSEKYTYIIDGGKTYTVTFIKWQNDFYSYPSYKKLIHTFNRYYGWYSSRTFFTYTGDRIDGGDFKPYFDNYLKGINGVPYYGANILEYITKCIGEKFMNSDDTMNYIIQVYRDGEKTVPYSDYSKLEAEVKGVLESNPDSLKLPKNKNDPKPQYTYFKNDLAYSKSDQKKILQTNEKELKILIGKVYDFFKQNNDWTEFIELNKKQKENKLKGNKRLTCLLKHLKSMNNTMESLKNSCKNDSELKITDEVDGNWGESKVIDLIKGRQFYLGVQKSNDGKFEISLYLDVVGGKVTAENVGKLGCIYTGEKLGSDFKILVDNDIFAESMRMYIDLEKAAKEALVEEGAVAAAAPAAAEPAPAGEKKPAKNAAAKTGGKKRTRKTRMMRRRGRFPRKTKKRSKNNKRV